MSKVQVRVQLEIELTSDVLKVFVQLSLKVIFDKQACLSHYYLDLRRCANRVTVLTWLTSSALERLESP